LKNAPRASTKEAHFGGFTMKNNISAALVIIGLSLSAAYAADNMQKNDAKKTDAMKTDTGKDMGKKAENMLKTQDAVLLPAQEIKWVENAEFPQVKTGTVEGDAKKGPHHSFHKFAAGFEVPLHHHTAEHFATIVSGNMIFTVEGKEYRMGPGGFFSFTSKQKHATKCESGADCVLFMDARGAFDVINDKPTKAER
jgi:mannose-6-phosphate isomerase-like protein (cupin superfamily)